MSQHTVRLTLAQLVSIIGENSAIAAILENYENDIADNIIEYVPDHTFTPAMPDEIADISHDSSKTVGDAKSAGAEFTFEVVEVEEGEPEDEEDEEQDD